MVEFRGSTEFTYHGNFSSEEPLQFNLRMNCTSSCQVPIIGPRAKLVISFSTFVGKVFLREYSHEITSASNIKKKYDDFIQDMEDKDSEEEERERNRKRRRTSNYR